MMFSEELSGSYSRMVENFWKMKDFSLFTVPYAYVDHFSYLADNLFVQRKITMKFKGEFEKEGSPYRIIMCRVLKRDVGRFEEALEKLKDKMLIMGYRDYDKVCADIGSLIDGEKERKKQ